MRVIAPLRVMLLLAMLPLACARDRSAPAAPGGEPEPKSAPAPDAGASAQTRPAPSPGAGAAARPQPAADAVASTHPQPAPDAAASAHPQSAPDSSAAPAAADPDISTAPSAGDVARAKQVGEAFTRWLKAAEAKDAAAFRQQLSRESRHMIEEDLRLPGESDPYAGLLKEIGGQAKDTRVVEVALTETHATVVYQEAGGKDAMPMVLEDGAWRVDLLGKMQEDLGKLQRGEIELDAAEITGKK